MKIQEISNLQSFSNKQTMDLRVRAFLFHHKTELSAGTLDVLKFIWRHSVKYPGVSFAKNETIEKKTGRSRSTVIRAINILVEKGLVKRVPATRPNGKRGVNILVILPEDETTAPWLDKEDQHPSGESQPEADEEKSSPEAVQKPDFDTDYLPSYIPKAFTSLTKAFLPIDDICSAWKSVTHAYRKFQLNYPVDHYITAINRTFKQSLYVQKKGMIKKTFLGYFYGGIMQTFTQVYRQEVMDDPSNLYYDWLHA
ncbi:helix-turn-helix domain-containing protein [Thalassobacillus devorans]|uniref:helix-turn-helix domain-containing protein n=1 Tax=Thalassobacillus devorans TaxID=279813 RepID=UPI00048F8DD5|nr:helix-turn-helix domain-containing protein [Thalassobacillus devorans]